MSTIEYERPQVDENPDVPPHPGRRLTEEEYVQWSGSFWSEWVDGEVIMMMSVNLDHATLSHFLIRLVGGFVEQRDLGAVLSEPYQVRFAGMRRRRAPDLFFISKPRLHMLKRREVEGAPDLCMEIVSPESEARDWREKFHEYEAAGVREYWILDPASGAIDVHRLRDGRYTPIPVVEGKIASEALAGFYFRPEWLRLPQLPRVHELLREMGV